MTNFTREFRIEQSLTKSDYICGMTPKLLTFFLFLFEMFCKARSVPIASEMFLNMKRVYSLVTKGVCKGN